MRQSGLIFIVLIMCMVNTVSAATGDILSSFTAPSAGTTGLAFDGTYLWIVDTLNRDIIRLTTTGSVWSSFSIPSQIVSPVDLAFDGTNLWVTDKTSDKVFQLATTGAVISSFDCPCTQPMGLAFDGTDLWVGSEPDEIVQVSTSGTLLSTIVSPVRTPQGLTYADDLLWVSGLVEDTIRATTRYGGLTVYAFPEPDDNTQGLAYDGTNLWATGSLTDTVFELELNPVMIIPSLDLWQLIILTGLMGSFMFLFCKTTKQVRINQ